MNSDHDQEAEFHRWLLKCSQEYKDDHRLLDVGTMANPILTYLNGFVDFLIAKSVSCQCHTTTP